MTLRSNGIAAVAAAAMLGLAAPASAASTPTSQDLRCVIISLMVASSGEGSNQAAGAMSSLYYLGRLDGRTPDLDLENQLIDELTSMRPADLKTEGKRCAEELMVRGQRLQELGQRIAKRGQSLKPNPIVPN